MWRGNLTRLMAAYLGGCPPQQWVLASRAFLSVPELPQPAWPGFHMPFVSVQEAPCASGRVCVDMDGFF